MDFSKQDKFTFHNKYISIVIAVSIKIAVLCTWNTNFSLKIRVLVPMYLIIRKTSKVMYLVPREFWQRYKDSVLVYLKKISKSGTFCFNVCWFVENARVPKGSEIAASVNFMVQCLKLYLRTDCLQLFVLQHFDSLT